MPEFPQLAPIADAPLSVVLLAWRPGTDLEAILTGWGGFLRERSRKRREGPADEIVLVEDGTTAEIDTLVQRLQQAHAPVVWQRHTVAGGVGPMLGTGLGAASRPLVLYSPCVAAYRPEFVSKLLGQIDPVHLASGYRAGVPVPMPLRVLGLLVRWTLGLALGIWPVPLPGWLGWRGHAARWVARLLFGVHNSDVGCPFRLIRREVLWRAPVQSRTWVAHVEVLAKLNFENAYFAEEVPLPVRPGEDGLPHDPLGAQLRDAWQVFTHPNFGPATQPVAEPTAEAVETPAAG